MDLLHHWFSFICGQNNCWYLAGQSLPMCQRCLGLYAGSACAATCCLLFRPRSTTGMLWGHGIFLLVMIPFGYHLVPQNGEVRTLTGWLFGFGLVYYMSTFVLSGRRTATSPLSISDGIGKGHTVLYFGCIVVGFAALLVAVHSGSEWTGRLLAAFSAMGFISLAALAALTLVTLARVTLRGFSRP